MVSLYPHFALSLPSNPYYIFRRLQRATKNKAEFTAQVSIPKNVENGPLLVKDIKKKDFISFVMPSEGGYKVSRIQFSEYSPAKRTIYSK